MNETELLWNADQNLADFVRAQARALPQYRIEERDELLFAVSGTRYPAGSFNCVFPLRAVGSDASQLLTDASRFFAPLDRGHTIYAPTHRGPELANVCTAAQYVPIDAPPGMVLSERLAPGQAPAGVEVRFARDAAGATDVIAVCASAYETMQLPASIPQKVFSKPERWLIPNYHALVLYENERPVSTAAVLFSHRIAGVYWVGTIPQARGRGYAELAMRTISNHAFDCGAKLVVLQASKFGEPIYRKLGYQEFTRYPFFLAPKQK